jgi:uncharacterized glyoxalase superfamily protein PhnB
MRLEHLALMMEDPIAAVKWYVENLGFTILKEMDSSPYHHFIIDSSKCMIIEIFLIPDKKIINYKAVDPAIMHLGFNVQNIKETYKRMIGKGATIVNELSNNENGDSVAMLRDPWGVPIQLIKRKKSLL